MSTMPNICMNCAHWRENVWPIRRTDHEGVCRRYPPQWHHLRHGFAFPDTEHNETCGEHVRKPEPTPLERPDEE